MRRSGPMPVCPRRGVWHTVPVTVTTRRQTAVSDSRTGVSTPCSGGLCRSGLPRDRAIDRGQLLGQHGNQGFPAGPDTSPHDGMQNQRMPLVARVLAQLDPRLALGQARLPVRIHRRWGVDRAGWRRAPSLASVCASIAWVVERLRSTVTKPAGGVGSPAASTRCRLRRAAPRDLGGYPAGAALPAGPRPRHGGRHDRVAALCH